MSAIRTWVLAAGTAALISSQAAYAVPVTKAPAVDPLLAVSALSSNSAACGFGTSCATAVAKSGAIPAAATSAAAVQPGPYDGNNRDWVGLGVLFFFPAVLIISMLLEDGNDSISISPD